VRQDLVLLRARAALVAARTELITALGKMLRDKDREKSKRVMQAMFRITKSTSRVWSTHMSKDEAMPGAAFVVQVIPEYLTLTCGYVDQRWLVNSFGMA
jgi:hypothetical protein